jgi:Protein of unknown function (DUF2795)
MADQSTQHGQRLDDQMEHEVEPLVRGAPVDARAREDLEFQPIEQSTVPLGDPEEDEHHREVIERSELARFLRPSAFPADAEVMIAVATEEHAPDAVLAELAQLPTGVQFATVGEIWEALGHEMEHRDTVHEPEPEPEHAAAPALESAETDDGADADAHADADADADEATFEPVAVLPAENPAGERTPPTPVPVVAPVPEPPSPGPVRGAVVFGLELFRTGLDVADRVLEGVERLVSR